MRKSKSHNTNDGAGRNGATYCHDEEQYIFRGEIDENLLFLRNSRIDTQSLCRQIHGSRFCQRDQIMYKSVHWPYRGGNVCDGNKPCDIEIGSPFNDIDTYHHGTDNFKHKEREDEHHIDVHSAFGYAPESFFECDIKAEYK